jgi:hypothetical protein
MLFEHRRAKKWKWTRLLLEIAKKAAMGGYFGSAAFHSFPWYAHCPFLLISQFLR